MRILHVIPYVGRQQGGPVESLRLLADAMAGRGDAVWVAHAGQREDGASVAFDKAVRVIGCSSRGPLRWAPGFAGAVERNGVRPDLVHVHGLWHDLGRRASGYAQRISAPLVVSPCGMLQARALQRSMVKKKLAWLLFQRGVLRSAAVIHAKSEAEAVAIRKAVPEVPCRVIPNPVAQPPAELVTLDAAQREKRRSETLGRYGIPPHERTLLFLGRLHPVKGLERLIAAWASLAGEFPQWRLVIVGPDEDGYRASLLKACAGIAVPPLFVDGVFGEARWELYAAADCLVAPSDFENFGLSIAEALALGIPVIATKGTPWPGLAEERCGWWVEPTVAGVTAAVREAFALSREERRALGGRARALVAAYAPDAVAGEMTALYRSLLAARAGGVVRAEAARA